jgi:uncharacterized protein involved in outer membrane biogenesis
VRFVGSVGRWLGGALALVLLVLAVGEATGWPVLRGVLQYAATRAADVPVTMQGSFRARLFWRPGIEAGQLRVGAGGGLPLPHLLDGRQVQIGWDWRDLWRWWRGAPLRLQSLSAGALDLQLVRTADGRASWQLGRRATPRPAGAPGDDLPRIGTFTLANGRLHVDDAPLATRLEVSVEGGETAEAPGASGYRLAAEGRWRGLPVKLQARTGGALPLLSDRGDDARAPTRALQVQGQVGEVQVSFEGRAAALVGSRRLDGELALAAPSLALLGAAGALTLPQTPPVQLRARIRYDTGLWQLDGAQAAIGRSRLGGDFRYDANTTPPRLTGTLQGTRLLLADLGPSIGTPPPAATPRAKAKAKARARAAPPSPPRRVLPQRRFDLPSLKAMDADVQAAIDELDFGTDALAPLHGLRTRVLLRDGVLDLQDLEARTAAGRVSGSSRLDGEARPARWSAKLRLADVDVARWLLAARRYLTGRLEADLELSGSGRSTAEILATLDGRALVMVRDGSVSHLVTELVGLDVAQALGVALRGDQRLPMRCARFDLAVADGVVTPRQAVLDNRDSTLHVGGSLDLGDESLALALRARPKDFSPLSLRSPVTLTGTLGAPRFGVEGGKVAGRVLGAVVLGAVVGPVAALLPLVDPGSGDTGDPCARPPSAQGGR